MKHAKGSLMLFFLVGVALAGFAAAQQGSEPSLAAITVSPATVVGGNPIQGIATLDLAAKEDTDVSLAVDPPDAARIPAQVTVPAGATSATFTIATPLSKIAIGGSDTVVSVYANYGVTKHTKFTILAPVSFDQMVDRVIQREHIYMETMKKLHPLAETYIQYIHEDKEHNVSPTKDTYFLGRLDFGDGTQDKQFENDKKGLASKMFGGFNIFSRHFVAGGFAQMAILDRNMKKSNYYFNFVRQEFLGEIRCIVVDVQPREKAEKGLFAGRIWVEDRDFNIVRFSGTYSNGSNYNSYLYFDTWRTNVRPGLWLPTHIYSEETDPKRDHPPFHAIMFKSQTRLWAYDVEHLKRESEMTAIQVESVADNDSSAKSTGPVESSRMWERMAEDNAIDHLQNIGLLAVPGEVDKILQTVVNNLIITNRLEIVPDVRVRVLMTTPLESFTVGHTIVVSRGLLDAVPDEATLAMMLSHELAHIALGHKINTKFAFTPRLFFSDEVTFERMNFERSKLDEEAADSKAVELLANSPYKDKLASAGLFLRALEEHASQLPSLIRPHLGNSLGSKDATRLPSINAAAPKLEENNIDQIAALPLGGRIEVDSWSNELSMRHDKPVTLLSAHEKMPFEVTPFFLYLTRHSSTSGVSTASLLVERRPQIAAK